MDRALKAPPEPVDEDLFAEIPMDEIIPLDLDENDNIYFKYPQIDAKTFPIDPALYIMGLRHQRHSVRAL